MAIDQKRRQKQLARKAAKRKRFHYLVGVDLGEERDPSCF